jgi:hypothetical protein
MILRIIAIIAAAAGLSACVSPSLVTGATTPGKNASKEQSAAQLAVLKEVNRHIELCDRTYGWPFTAVITCSHQPPAEAIAEMIDRAVAKALAASKSPPAS